MCIRDRVDDSEKDRNFGDPFPDLEEGWYTGILNNKTGERKRAPQIEDRVVFSNSVINLLDNDADDCQALKAYVEIAPSDGNAFSS